MTTKEAITLLRRMQEPEPYEPQINEAAFNALDMAIKALEQPEIIRCKDCKHRDPEDKKCDCGHGILWQLPRDDDWYCADAEGEEP